MLAQIAVKYPRPSPGYPRHMHAGARQAFEQTALPNIDVLYSTALRLTRNPAEAEDLVQDTMVRAYRFWDGFIPGTSIKAWLLTILRNTFINAYHRQNRTRKIHGDLGQQVAALGPSTTGSALASEPPGPEQALGQKLTRERILAALESLPEDYRMAVVLADLEQLSYKEIAEVMQCPIGTVMSRIHRGRRLLYRLLHDNAVELGIVDAHDNGSGPSESVDPEPELAAPVPLSAYRKRGKL